MDIKGSERVESVERVERPLEAHVPEESVEGSSVDKESRMAQVGAQVEAQVKRLPGLVGSGVDLLKGGLEQVVSTAKSTLGVGQAEVPKEMAGKMHALVWHGKHDIRYELVDKPEIKNATDALIRVTATTICGSDLHFYNNEFPEMKKGDIVGHEFMGIVQDLGAGVTGLSRGQRVVVAFDIACGSCEHCRREEFTACDASNPSKSMDKLYGHRSAGLFGYSHATGGYDGGQAEFVRVPWAEINCLPVPDSVPDDRALYLSDIIPTSYHACMLGEVKEGDVVGIWGMGPIGLLAARWCQVLGASRVIGISGTQQRLDLARKALGIDVINYNEQKVNDALRELIPRGLDVAIDCTGYRFAKGAAHRVQRALYLESDTPEVITECVTALRPYGHLSIIADYIGNANNFPIGHIAMKHLYLASGQSPTQKYWKYCLSKLQSGEFDPTFLVTHELPLSEGPSAYQKFNDHDEGYVKVLLRPFL